MFVLLNFFRKLQDVKLYNKVFLLWIAAGYEDIMKKIVIVGKNDMYLLFFIKGIQ